MELERRMEGEKRERERDTQRGRNRKERERRSKHVWQERDRFLTQRCTSQDISRRDDDGENPGFVCGHRCYSLDLVLRGIVSGSIRYGRHLYRRAAIPHVQNVTV
jgi:hypothetical protein